MADARGSIYSAEAYALGKMLDHSSWQHDNKIVRLITPSDIDMCLDNNGHVLFGEFSSTVSTWSEIKTGQRRLYESAIRGGPHCAVVCRHNVRVSDQRLINSRTDILSFQAMFYDHGIVCDEVREGNDLWQRFVQAWLDEPLNLRRKLLRRSAAS